VRIIAGRLKGRRLEAPTWTGLRPTSDKLRETLFNLLQHETPGARFFDGFAGTGAVGIEALSRGATHVTFAETDRRACQLIAGNLRRCGVDAGYTIERADALSLLAGSDATFDIVFLDPPYDAERLEDVVAAGVTRLASGGVLVLEHASRRASPLADGATPPGTVSTKAPTRATPTRTTPTRATLTRVLKSGDSALSLYTALSPEPEP
jgi:16S rRNA (guanine966-N2)-methyltransferase